MKISSIFRKDQPVHPTDEDWVKIVKKKGNGLEQKAARETRGVSRGNSCISEQRKTATKARARHVRPHAIMIKALGEVSTLTFSGG